MVNVGLLAAEIAWRVWGTPANFNWFRDLASLLHRRRSTEVNQTLHDVRPFAGLVLYILGALVPNGILLGAKFTLLFIPFSKTLEQRFLQIAEPVNMGNHPQNTVEFSYAY